MEANSSSPEQTTSAYSKNPEETFTIWDREQVLADAVWVIRNFRPDVMITRFPHTPSRTHGHHTASSQIAYAAFEAAADPTRFPEQLKYTSVWQPKRLVWNAYARGFSSEEEFEAQKADFIQANVGTYYPLLGQSNNEIAGKSTSQHQCQGMGAPQERGAKIEYFQHLKGTNQRSIYLMEYQLPGVNSKEEKPSLNSSLQSIRNIEQTDLQPVSEFTRSKKTDAKYSR